MCVSNHTVSFWIYKNEPSIFWSHLQSQLEESARDSQVRTRRPVIRTQGCFSGRTVPSAEPASDWWRDAKAQTKPGMCAGRGRESVEAEQEGSVHKSPQHTHLSFSFTTSTSDMMWCVRGSTSGQNLPLDAVTALSYIGSLITLLCYTECKSTKCFCCRLICFISTLPDS